MNPSDKIERYRQEVETINSKVEELAKKRETLLGIQSMWKWFISGADLQATDAEITFLKEKSNEIYKLIEVLDTQDLPKVEWQNAPLYWKRLNDVGLIIPFEQYVFYCFFAGSISYASWNLYKGHHLYQLTHYPEKSERWTYHWARARVTPQQIELASCYWIGRFRLRGSIALGVPLLFGAYLVACQ